MAEQTQESTSKQQDRKRRAEAKAHAASRVKKEMATHAKEVKPSSDAALRFQKQKDEIRVLQPMEERENMLAKRAMTIAPRSSILAMIAA
jgi:hypothetical protein